MSNLLASERCRISFAFDRIGSIDFIGVSRAASGTAVAVPQLKLQLDAGMNVFNFQPDTVLTTHCHADHSFRLTHFVSRTKKPLFFMPVEMVDIAEAYLLSSQSLSNGSPLCFEQYECNHISKGVIAGDNLKQISSRNSQVGAHIIRCHHGAIPSVGYAFYVTQRMLKEQFRDEDKNAISARVRNGETVSEEVEVPLFIFLGDTTTAVYDGSMTHNVAEYFRKGWKVIFAECSFIEDSEIENSARTGHTHWIYLKPIILSHPSVTFVLMHFSRRYKKAQIDEFFAAESIPNIRLFIADDLGDLTDVYEVPNPAGS